MRLRHTYAPFKRLTVSIVLTAAMLFQHGSHVYAAEWEFEKNEKLYTYDDMERDLFSLAEQYGSQGNGAPLSLTSLGSTVDARNIYCLRIGAEEARYTVLVTASIHGREYMTTRVLMHQLAELLENTRSGREYSGLKYADLLKDIAIYAIPMVNPDGVTISQLGTDGLRNSEIRAQVYHTYELDGAIEIAPYLRSWKSNARGVDLNRNFDALWEFYDDRVGHPSADHFKGNAPGSEAESAALIRLTEEVQFDRTLSYHTQGELIYWYFGQTGELYIQTKQFAERIGRSTGFRLDADYQDLDPAGYKDWAIMQRGIPSLTIEMGKGSSPVEEAQYSGIQKQMKHVLEETVLSIFDSGLSG